MRYYGDPILRERARDVTVFDARLRELAADMVETMEHENGVGLAAPQIGESVQLLVALRLADPDDETTDVVVLVNPEILSRSQDTWVHEEGCLSIPGVRGNVTRPSNITVRYRDLDGNEHVVEAENMFARILQHEIDHLNGKLFIDYLSPAAKVLIKPRLKRLASRSGDE